MRGLISLVLLSLTGSLGAQAQWSTTGNTGTTAGTNYLGTNDAERLLLKTEGDWRLMVNENESYDMNAAFTGMPADGFIGISPTDDFWDDCFGPFSRLHLAEGFGDNTQSLGYRPWMRNGISLTGNADQGYMGQKYAYADPGDHTSEEREDTTDMIIQWSDNPGKARKDRMRFIFTSGYDEAETGAGSLEGLEGMRLFPEDEDQVNVGFGDFFAGNIDDPGNVVEPTDRVDILTGRLRIRELPEDDGTEFDKVLVVDDTDPDDDDYGVVKWRSAAGIVAADDCKWTIDGGTNDHDVWTALGTGTTCPNRENLVGIGVNPTAAKLHVVRNVVTDGTPRQTIRADIKGDATSNWHTAVHAAAEPNSGTSPYLSGVVGNAFNATTHGIATRGVMTTNAASISATEVNGVRGESQVNASGGTVSLSAGVYADAVCSAGTVNNNYGVYARGYAGTTAYGVFGLGTAASSTAVTIGVRGQATNGTSSNIAIDGIASTGGTKYGVRGNASGTGTNYAIHGTVPDTSTNNWAGFFAGKVQVQGNMWHNGTFIFSDSELKTGVEAIDAEDGTELLSQLTPRSYHYNAEQFPQMNLPTSTQFGFLAQEMEQVLPQLVGTTVVPEVVDSMGNVLSEEMEVKGINYVGLIPLLVAGYQQQQERIEQLEESLANCCADMGGGDERMDAPNGGSDLVTRNERALTIQPNPFNERTVLYYTLERNGRMQLIANSADGKQLRVLHEAKLEAGQYQHEWQTSELTPGVYYVTLLLDGEPIVKKAVKVQR